MLIFPTTYDFFFFSVLKRKEYTTFAHLLNAFLLPFIWLFTARKGVCEDTVAREVRLRINYYKH